MDFATRKLGPLPVWAWAVVGLVGFLAIRWYRAKGAQANPPATADTQAAADQQTQQLLAALTGATAAITAAQTASPNPGSPATTTTGGQPPPPNPGGTFWAWRVLPSGRLSAPEEFFLAPNLAAQPGRNPYQGGLPLGFPSASSLDSGMPPWMPGGGFLPGVGGGGVAGVGGTLPTGSTSGVSSPSGGATAPMLMPAPGPAASIA